MERKKIDMEQSFDINKVSFDNVSSEFEKTFKEKYKNSLGKISDVNDPLTNASGVNTLGLLEEMARRIDNYDQNADFENSFNSLLKEYEPFTET